MWWKWRTTGRCLKRFGFIGMFYPFDENEESWSQYIDIFEHYYVANGGSTDEDKIKLLFCVLALDWELTITMKNLYLPA